MMMRKILVAMAIVLAVMPCVARADITTGLLAWYQFEEGTGTTADDSSANNKDGTLANGAAWTTGVSGRGVSLDGTDDYISLPTALGIDNVGALTIGMWFKPASLGDFEMLFSHYVSDSQRIELGLSGGGQGGNNDAHCLLCTGSTPHEFYTTDTRAAVGRWEPWCVVFDGSLSGNESRLKFYHGGKRVANEPYHATPPIVFNGTIPATTTNNSSTASYIGARSGTGFRLHGDVDEVRIYNRALTAADVAELANWKLPTTAVYPMGGLGIFRCVKITAAGEFALCSASDIDRCGFTTQTTATLEAAASTTITAGAVVYQAADGKISHTGTIRVGVANQQVQATGPELWSVFVD